MRRRHLHSDPGAHYKITEEMDRVYGVNHNQIDSIGHRTTRYLRAQSGGFLKAEPVMMSIPKTAEDAANIKRIVHNTSSIYGILVSLDDRAALVRANFIEGRLDHRRTFTEINERVIAPFERAGRCPHQARTAEARPARPAWGDGVTRARRRGRDQDGRPLAASTPGRWPPRRAGGRERRRAPAPP